MLHVIIIIITIIEIALPTWSKVKRAEKLKWTAHYSVRS
jgi:hypothetical protein